VNISLTKLTIRTKKTTETISFSPSVTFFHGPVGTGKSTVARLIDYALGGDLERTPAIRSEFLAAELTARLGSHVVQFDRAADDGRSVRVTWSSADAPEESLNAPLDAGTTPIWGDSVFNLSDLVFNLCGVEPIKVRKSKLDPDSPLVRLSFRDVMWYCYLQQDRLDSSFFRMDDPFKGLKSRDVMRFVTGLHSDRMNQLDAALVKTADEQRSKREAVAQIRRFMTQFDLGTEIELHEQINLVRTQLQDAIARRDAMEQDQTATTHVLEPMRVQLRHLSDEVNGVREAIADIDRRIQQQEALRSELITTKVKANRAEQAGRILSGVAFTHCPQCGSDLNRVGLADEDHCSLCRNTPPSQSQVPAVELEALRRDLNERIDDLADTVNRHKRERTRLERRLAKLTDAKEGLDRQLAQELAKYDSAFVSQVRAADREVATLQERIAALERLSKLPEAIDNLEREAGELQGKIDNLKSAITDERQRLARADVHIKAIADAFLSIIREVGFPGVYEDDTVRLDPRNWLPYIVHDEQPWGFADAGSGGKKTLFNVCYALAVHNVARLSNLPLPTFLIIDSPTKNISQDENPELVQALYKVIYRLAAPTGCNTQFILIDSDLVGPDDDLPGFVHRRMAIGEPNYPPLISYYDGP